MDGPAITVNGKASSAAPRIGDGNSVGFDFTQRISQVIDNFSLIRGKHALKTGIDAQWIGDERVRGDLFLYTFATINDYLAAKSGANPLAYANLQQQLGDVTASYNSRFYGMFVQDDWQIASRMKLLYGVRYDLFDVPEARQFAANPYSKNFTIDKNNFGPRAGVSWSLDNSARTVVRASIGMMYEPPLLDFYDNAILNNGDPKRYNVGPVLRTAAGAPAFPSSLATPPPGFVLPKQSINAVDPGLRDAVGLAEQHAARTCARQRFVGLGRLRQLDRPQPAGADGRQPVADRARPSPTAGRSSRRPRASTRHSITSTCSSRLRESNYNAFTATLTKRMTHGWQAQATYTLARGMDNAPLTGTYVVGSNDDRVSDPTNLDRDKGVTPFNQTHTLSVSAVVAPQVSGDGLRAMLLEQQPGRRSSSRRTAACRSTSARTST